jgi:phosphatidylglycerol:prolipoprotein diacylglycerol transferase
MGLAAETILSLAMWVFVPGIVGARLFFVIQKWSLIAVRDADQQIDWGRTLATIISFQEGGLVVYGSMIGGFLGGVIFVTRQRLPILALADLVAPSVMVGLAIGRVGCLLNGCCFGGLCEPTSPFYSLAVTFPRAASPELEEDRPAEAQENSPAYGRQREQGLFHGILVEADGTDRPVIARLDPKIVVGDGPSALRVNDHIEAINGARIMTLKTESGSTISPVQQAYRLLAQAGLDLSITTSDGKLAAWSIPGLPDRSLPVYATQLFSAITAALVALLLWFYYPVRRRDGEVFALLLTVYPIARWLLEVIRDDEGGQFGTWLTISQWVSAVILVTAIGLWASLARRPTGSALPLKNGAE